MANKMILFLIATVAGLMVIKSIIFGLCFFAIMMVFGWVLKSEVHWQSELFGSVIAAAVYFAFQWQDKKYMKM